MIRIMSGTYDSAVSNLPSETMPVIECIARLPPLAIFIQSLVICVSDTRSLQNSLLMYGERDVFRVIKPSGKGGIQKNAATVVVSWVSVSLRKSGNL